MIRRCECPWRGLADGYAIVHSSECIVQALQRAFCGPASQTEASPDFLRCHLPDRPREGQAGKEAKENPPDIQETS